MISAADRYCYERNATKSKPATKLSFSLNGQTISDLKVEGGGYPLNPDGDAIKQVVMDCYAAIMVKHTAGINSANAVKVLGDGTLKFEAASTRTLRHLPTTSYQEALCLAGNIYIWDPYLFSGYHPKTCPCCSGKLEGNGLGNSTKHFKGTGSEPDAFVVTRRWKCNNKAAHNVDGVKREFHFLDTDASMRALLPQPMQTLYPFLHQTPNTGLTSAAANLLNCLGAEGTATEFLVKAFNDSRQRKYAASLIDWAARREAAGSPSKLGYVAVGDFPSRDLLDISQNKQYLGEALNHLQAAQVEYSNRLMADRGAEVIGMMVYPCMSIENSAFHISKCTPPR